MISCELVLLLVWKEFSDFRLMLGMTKVRGDEVIGSVMSTGRAGGWKEG